MKPEMRQHLAQVSFEEHEMLSGSARVDDIQGHPQSEVRGQTNFVKTFGKLASWISQTSRAP